MKQDMIQKSTPRAGALTRLLLTALIALTTLAACHDELADDRLSSGTHTVTLSVSMPAPDADGTQTRVAYDDADLKLKWQEGDQLKVYQQSSDVPLGTLTIDSKSISADSTSAKFTGEVSPATGTYSLRYAPAGTPAPDAPDATTPAQVQTGNANPDHLRSHLALSADNVSSLNEPVTLTLDAAILKVHIAAADTLKLGVLSSLQWSSKTARGIRTMTLGLNGVTPTDGSITAYIAFRPTEMSLVSGGTFSVILTAGDIPYIAFTASASGMLYKAGERYTVEMSGGIVGNGVLPLRPQRVVGDGTKPLDLNIFNQYSPVWVITGGGDADATVATHVQAALPKVANTINLTLKEVKALPEKAFERCTALATASLPAATIIGDDALKNCKALASIELPVATIIGDSAFKNCIALTSIELPAATIIGDSAFNKCFALTTINLPKATKIGAGAFYNCFALTSVNLPAATIIEGNAFSYCTFAFLTSVNLPAATIIGNNAFDNCKFLTNVDLPTATNIGKSAFNKCNILASVNLPAATSIGESAFTGCDHLISASLPAATTIGASAFYGCIALTRLELTAADTITFKGGEPFYRFDSSNCTLVLNSDKKPGGSGSPKVDPDDKTWGGVTWESIEYVDSPATRRRP